MAIDKSLMQGSLSMLVLRLLEEKDMYGYEMIETLRGRSNNVFELKAGSLYPLLHTLEAKNLVTAYEEDASGKVRKYYHLTGEGKKVLREKKAEWQEYSAAVTNVLSFRGRAEAGSETCFPGADCVGCRNKKGEVPEVAYGI